MESDGHVRLSNQESGTEAWSPGFETPFNKCSFVDLKPDTEYDVQVTHKTMLARVNLRLPRSRRTHVQNRKSTLPNNTPTELSLPDAVGALPTPVEATPGTFVVMTEPEKTDCSRARRLGQVCIQPSDRRSTRTPAWHGPLSIPTALRACKSLEPGRWTAFPLRT